MLLNRTLSISLASALAVSLLGSANALAVPGWSEKDIQKWNEEQGWLLGPNYIPRTAINQLEMWQADTFDPKTIDDELAKMQGLGMNTARVFLHDLAWQQDPEGFKKRVDTFLALAAKHKIRPMLVLFDSVWNPEPKVGKQPAPIPGVHNSGWVQSPGGAALENVAEHGRLESYVKAVIGAFGNDPRVSSWDVWNEPDNLNASSYGAKEPKNKLDLVARLLPQVFAWARSVKPKQPLTSGLWQGDWSSTQTLTPIQRTQLEESDFISFHNYDDPTGLENHISQLEHLTSRPKCLTEYMARGRNSTFTGTLPIIRTAHIGGYNWGFVQGKAQTEIPWDSWAKPYVHGEPPVWFHEIFRSSGKPYKMDEVRFIRRMTGATKPAALPAPKSAAHLGR